MDKLLRGRRPVRFQLTKTVKEVEKLLTDETSDNKALRVSGALLEKTAAELEKWDAKIQSQLLDDEATEDVVDKEFEESEKYRRSYLNVKTDLDDFLASSFSTSGNVETGSIAGDGRKRKFHLPEVKLNTFGGDLKDWLGWWSQFEKIHLDEDLHDTDKFQYLAQAMLPATDAKAIVDSYPQTEGNYVKAVEALQDRFGRHDILLQVYVRQLLTLVIGNVTSNEKLPLAQLCVRLESHLRCLAELNLDKADPATWLYPLVESSLSEEVMRAFHRSPQSLIDGSAMTPPKTRLDLLMELIKSEVHRQIVLAKQGFKSSEVTPNGERPSKAKPRSNMMRKFDDIPTAAGLITHQSNGCGVCGKQHETEKCYKFQRMNLAERKAENADLGGSRTLAKSVDGSPAKRLKSDQQKKLREPMNIVQTFNQNSNQCSRTVLMNTLKVNVQAKDGRLITVRLVGDSGSQRSYISSDTILKSRSVWIGDEWLQNVLFGGQLTPPMKFARHEVTLQGLNGSQLTLQLLKKDQITGEISEVHYGPWIEALEEKGIVLTDLGAMSSAVDILIGNEHWGAIRTGRMVKLLDGLVAEETVFGWTLGGKIPVASSMIAMSMTVGSQEIEKLWSLEAFGIRETVDKLSSGEEEKQALSHFRETVRRDDGGRYVVSLPWRECPEDLPSGREVAEQRLKASTFKLQKIDKLQCYHNVFLDWEKEGLVVKVMDGMSGGHFVPHRPVFKESTTTPVRPVFDASCRVGRNASLNDVLYKGPNLIELIPVMLLRFGEKRIGVSADIRKAFQMLKVKVADQQFQRFLWWADLTCKKIVVYQHTRLVFGFTCSPFLLGAVIQHHLDLIEDKQLAEKLKSAFYVDNLVASVDSKKEYDEFRSSSVKVMADAGMDLRQWAYSIQKADPDCNVIIADVPQGQEMEEPLIMPILGVQWNREADTLSCIIKEYKFDEVTKRNILSVVAQMFDPTGFLCPVLLLPKLLIQESWSSKLGWDKPVPENSRKRFLKWTNELSVLKEVQVPRYYQVENATTREVHVFCDSSQDAMAAVAFLRTELNGSVAVQFLLAKSRLTPVKKPTIPRAELIRMGVRIAKCIEDALKLNQDCFTFWSNHGSRMDKKKWRLGSICEE